MIKAIYNIDGVDYKFSGVFGSQLESLEPLRHEHGYTRVIAGFLMFVTDTYKNDILGFNYRTNWALVGQGSNIDEYKEKIYYLKESIAKGKYCTDE